MKYLCLSIFLVCACGSSQRPTTSAEENVRAPSVSWSFIPKDSPFVYATVGAFSALPWPGNDEDGYVALGKRVAELEVQGVNARKQLPDYEGKVLRGLELLGKNFRVSDSDLDRLGVGSESRLTVYGVGLNVAARIEISQPRVLEGHLATLFAELELGGVEKTLNGVPYWEFVQEKYTVFVALLPSELVAGLRWQGDAKPLLASLLGPPVNEVDPTAVLKNISQRVEVGEYVGYVDVVGAARGFSDMSAGANPTEKSPEQTTACRSEQDWMASAVPQLWFSGSVDKERAHGLLFADLSARTVTSLKKMMRPVPQIVQSSKDTPLLSFSLGLDVGLAIGHTRMLLNELARKDFACDDLKSIPPLASTWGTSVKTLGMTPLAGLTGVSGVLQSRHFDPRGNLEAKGILAIAHASPASLLNLLRLVPDAKIPASLAVGAAPAPFYIKEMEVLGPTSIALGTDAMGITVGMPSELSKTLAKPVGGEAKLLHLYFGSELLEDDDEEEGEVDGVYDEAMAEAILAIDEGLFPNLHSTEMTIRAVDRGVEIRFEARIQSAE